MGDVEMVDWRDPELWAPTFPRADVDAAFAHYLETAAWTGKAYREGGHDEAVPLDDWDDWDSHLWSDDRDELHEDWSSFLDSNHDDVREFMAKTGRPLSHVAHDFHLTRNGHGAGFWDRGAGDVGHRLTEAARVFGTAELCGELDDSGELVAIHLEH